MPPPGAAACALLLLTLLAARAHADEQATTEFDPATRGNQMHGDPCTATADCGFAGSVCTSNNVCDCEPGLDATNHIDKCGKKVGVNETCFFDDQCEQEISKTECRGGRCVCLYEMVPELGAYGIVVCVARNEPLESPHHVDPAMIGVLVGMALMFVIICVVLRLFSNARWRENRTIFNTPNPRLMNVSLLRDSKLLHQDGRRGSRASMRPPSRQASQNELRAHSPNQGSRRGSRASSTLSASSVRSAKSQTAGNHNNHNNHSAAAPITESVTIEIRAPKA